MRRLIVVGALVLSACANPYAQYYQGLQDARTMPSYEQAQGDIQIYGTDNFDRDVPLLIRRGYQPIGRASFNAASNKVTEAQLREQAQKIGAHVVLTSSRYTHTLSGAVPMTIPQTTTSYSSGTATAYGRGGVVNAYGSGTTTTYGSQTMMMPYSVARSDFAAVFFAKTRSRFGIQPVPVDDETRKRLQTNAGVKVSVVIEGTPAFQADVLPGDIILAVGGESVQSPEHFIRLLDKYEGRAVAFKIDREGKTLEKQIEILPLKKPSQ